MASLGLPADTIVIGDKYPELIKYLLEEENRNVILVGSPGSNVIIREFYKQHHMGLYRFVVDESLFAEEQRVIEQRKFVNMTSDEIRELVAGFQCSEYISPWKRLGIPTTPQTGVHQGFVGLAQHPYHDFRVAIVAGGMKSFSTMYALSMLGSAEIMKYPLGTLYRVTIRRPDLPIGLDAYQETQVELLDRPYQIQEVQKQLSVPEISSRYGIEYDRLAKWVEGLANVRQR